MPASLRAAQPDREAKLFLRILSPFVGKAVDRDELESSRHNWRLAAMTFGRRIPMASIVDQCIDGPNGPIDLRIYTPEGARGLRPGFLWCHGGGFVVGDLDTSEGICRGMARAANAVVVAVRYRLAPEHDLYAGREDFLAALNWIAAHGATVGIDSDRLAIGGDSAGGNISAAVAQETLRRGGPKLSSQVLVYPATNLAAEFPSKAENGQGYLLTAEFMDSLEALIVQGRDLTDPWLSPAFSSDLRGLPPTVIITAGFDPIRDDGLSYAVQLRDAGVPVELLHYSGQFHGFLNFDSVIGAARDALGRIGDSLARAYRDKAPSDCTVEISDQTPSPFPGDVPRDLLSAAFMTNRSIRQINSTTARLLAPEAAKTLGLLLSPWWVPMAFVRRAVTSSLNPLVARQTYLSAS
jgi:acetyl esterase